MIIKFNINKIIFSLFLIFVIILLFKKLSHNEYFANLSDSQVDKDFGKDFFISVGDKYKKESGGKYDATYGELLFPGVKKIYEICKENNVPISFFVDLGCGNGKTLFYAISSGFDKAKGVELTKERVDYGKKVWEKQDQDIKKRINFEQKDILKLNKDFFNNVHCVFISNLLFPKETTNNIYKMLSDYCPKNTLIFSSRKPSENYGLKNLPSIIVPMSWDKKSEVVVFKKE